MFQEELKKIGIKQHVLLILVLLLIIQGVYIGCRGLYSQMVTKTAERNDEIYEEFYSQLKGKWNQNKEEQMDRWLQERDDSLETYGTKVEQFLAGEISEEDLYTYYQKTPLCQTKYSEVLDELEKQKNYINENPEKRHMMKMNGWVYFFEDHFVYHLYFLFLLVLFIPLFIREKETKMDLLQGLSSKGPKQIFICKILAASITMWLGLFLLMSEKYILYYVRCKMQDITNPIQSLIIFENCPWNISIGAGIITEILILACGGYLLGSVIIFSSMFIPRALDVCLLILIVVFVPMFICPEEILFRYPNITTFLYPDTFIYGWRDIDIGKQVYKTQNELRLMGTVTILAGTVLLWLARKRGQKK